MTIKTLIKEIEIIYGIVPWIICSKYMIDNSLSKTELTLKIPNHDISISKTEIYIRNFCFYEKTRTI